MQFFFSFQKTYNLNLYQALFWAVFVIKKYKILTIKDKNGILLNMGKYKTQQNKKNGVFLKIFEQNTRDNYN